MTIDQGTAVTERALEQLRRERVSAVSPEPRYLQAARAIETILDMYNQALEVPIPPETEMAAALGIGRATLRQALAHLTQQGRVYAKRGVGTFLAPTVLNRPARLNSLFDDLQEAGLRPTTQVLLLETVEASTEVAADLHIAEGQPLAHIRRVRKAAGKPVALIENLLNLSDAPLPLATDLEQSGLYSTLRSRYGIELGMATLSVSARLATTQEHKLLGVPKPCALLVARRLAFDTAGHGIEIGTTVYSEGAEIAGIRLQP